MCASSLNKPSSQEGLKLVERLRFDAVRCELQFSKGVAKNIEEAADLIAELQAALYLANNRADNLEQNYQEVTTRHPSFNDAIEAAIKCVEDERLLDHTGQPDDSAYNMAIEHAIESIRSLKLPDYRGGE